MKLPAGLIDDNLEIFSVENDVYALYHGRTVKFWELPIEIVNRFYDEMFNNKEALKALKEKKIENDKEMLNQYLWCNYGGFDFSPDNASENFEYWDCGHRGSCNFEGRLCRGLKSEFGMISKREIQIIKLIASDFSSKEIADKLCISYHTVTTHRRNIENKLNAHSSVSITLFAAKNNLV